MKGGILIIILIQLHVASGQNLVHNPSFEDFIQCPFSHTLSHQKKIVPGWVSPTKGTPDYFNSCSVGSAGVPSNWAGHCQAYAGTGYVGIYLHKEGGYKEYLQGTFLTALDSGRHYKIGLHASHALNSEFLVNQIEVVISKLPIISNDAGKLQIPEDVKPLTSQLCDNLIKSGQDWEDITFDYLATGQEKYITIGNFANDLEQTWKFNDYRYQPEPMLDKSSYILIDGVFVIVDGYSSSEPTDTVQLILSEVTFESNCYEIIPMVKDRLDSVLSTFSYLDYSVIISAHTDDIGSDLKNLELSKKRSRSIMNFFKEKEIAKERISVFNLGESVPIASNETEEGRAQNRRVEIEFIRMR